VKIRFAGRSARSRFLPFAFAAVVFAFQASTTGEQGRAAQPPAGAQQGPGGRGAAPVGRLGGRGGPQTPDGALAPNAPHPAPLPIDIFTTKNFYKDTALWSDPKYFRCNISRNITEMWSQQRMGDNPPGTAGWGDCSRDYPAASIKSPYAYKTAKEHYDALMADAAKRGGPTVHTRQTLPEWDGFYVRNNQDGNTQWLWGIAQPSTMLSLLTPEYKKRMVQEIYHESVTNAPQWSASFCYPEGLVRFYTQFAVQQPMEVMMNTSQVQFLSGIADNFLFKVLIGRKHVQQVPQWYGETVGFWDGDTLVSWTANVQGWTITHGLFEYSNKLETIEIIKPYLNNGAFAGLSIETIFYDPDAFIAPLRSTMRWNRTQKADSPTLRHTFVECLSNVMNTDGRPTQLAPTDPRYIDFYDRPWAKNWEKNFEKGWDKPEGDVPAAVLDVFK
jgi:hypothetical protein